MGQKCSKRAGWGGSTDKWLQVSIAHSCRRFHDREQQLNGCQAMLSKDPRSARLGCAEAEPGVALVCAWVRGWFGQAGKAEKKQAGISLLLSQRTWEMLMVL